VPWRGDEVKLIFRLERDDGAVAVERMWVEVVDTDPYVGLLRNEPQLEGVVAFGDRVEFAPAHVAAYAYTPAQLGYDPAERCFLLKRVAESDEPPPLLLFTGEDWEAHAEDESDEEMVAENTLLWTTG
jgi:uncharacterized protein YegJ (DUF2314 family)